MSKPCENKALGTHVGDLLPDFLPATDTYMIIAREIAPLLTEDDFSDAYGDRGPNPFSPKRLALVTLFQFMEKCPDRESARMVKMRLDWKIVLKLPLEHEGFHYSILCDFRSRLLRSKKSSLVFDRMLERLEQLGLVRPRGKQRLDSTHVVGCVKMLSRVELVTESLRVAIEALEAGLGEAVVQAGLSEELLVFAGVRPNFPKLNEEQRRRTLLDAGRYALEVLRFVDGQDNRKGSELEAIQILRKVVAQQFRVAASGKVEPLAKKEKKKIPGPERIASPHDPEARYGEKRGKRWVGYKIEIVETAEAEQPNFITAVQVQNAADADGNALVPMTEELAQKDLLPEKLYVDQAYVSGEKIDLLKEKYNVDLRGTVAEESHKAVFPQSRFQIDAPQKKAICPNGKANVSWSLEADGVLQLFFADADCAACPLRPQCTTGKRARHLRINPHLQTLTARREEQKQEAFIQEMHSRNAIEGTVSELKRGYDLRRSRYRGSPKLRLQAFFTVAAANLTRLARVFQSGFLAAPAP